MSDEPVTVDPSLFAEELVRTDATLEEKERFLAPTIGAAVRRPGEAETVRPLPPNAAPRAAVRGQHNWVPIGPRNVGGRVRALAVDPANPQIMYAAPAAGGIYKTLDGADSWFPLWHDEPSLSMAAISICAGTPAVVWAATGEVSGQASFIAPGGVLRSANSGDLWSQPNVGEAIRSARIHALAAHPTDTAVCWAAAEDGLYRTTNSGSTWHTFGAGRAFTDVKFLSFGGVLRLFVVPQGPVVVGPPSANRALVVRLDRPDDPDATLDVAIPAFPGAPFAPGADPLLLIGSPTPALSGTPADARNGRLAIYPGGTAGFADPVVFVAFANVDGGLYGIFRSTDAHTGNARNRAFVRLPHRTVMNSERQGDYNLALAVSPRNPNHVAFGMQELYLNRSAAAAAPTTAHWLRAQVWALYHVERGHHADHHALVFAPVPPAPFTNGVTAGAIALWDANDGGVSWCANWEAGATFDIGTGATLPVATLPLPPDNLVWRKRSHGISASMMYDLTQHPRLPTVMGCGFQDNGVYVGYGGPSWQLVLTADGGFVAFDPDDPYRLLSTWQSGITESRFPGRLRDALPLLRESVTFGLWPRELTDGFHDSDPAAFVAETVLHPTAPGRALTARHNRLYGTRPTTGERWHAEPLGTSFEILHRPSAAGSDTSTIEVLDTPGARALGFLPQINTVRRAEEARFESRARSLANEPFAIGPGLALDLTFSNNAVPAVAPVTVSVPLVVGPNLPASARAVQVATYLTGAIRAALAATPAASRPQVQVLPIVAGLTREIIIVSSGAGAARQVVLSGTTAASSARARAFHGADAGTGPGAASAALPAIAPLLLFRSAAGIDLTGETLGVAREGGGAPITFTWDADLVDSANAPLAEVLNVLRSRLPAADYAVWSGASYRGIRLTSMAATDVTLAGNLAPDLPTAPATARSRRFTGGPGLRRDTFDLSQTGAPPADRNLRIAEGGHQTAIQALGPAFLSVAAPDLVNVTAVELCGAIRQMLAAAPTVRVRCDLDVFADVSTPGDVSSFGQISELAFGPVGSRLVWAGDSGCRLYRSTDDGESWFHVPSPFDDNLGEIDAIAVRPDRPGEVLVGRHVEGGRPAPAHFLLRTTDAGATWSPILGPPLDGAGDRIGVRAIVFDTATPGHAYAATDSGMFRSTDSGDTWAAFNEGLPRAPIMDVTFEPTTRMLRAGVWGRGVHERHVGPRAVKDVALYLRSTLLDDGTSQPAPGPDLQALVPTALRFDTSPDIKVLRREPRTGVVLDGVEFDDELRCADVREGPAFIAVQVHNRGAFSTTGVRVLLMWAPADAGPPSIPPSCWLALNNPVPAGTPFGPWKVIGDETIAGVPGLGHDIVAPGYPRVNVFGAVVAFAWSAADLAGHRRIGLFAIAFSPDDPLGPARPTPVDVLDLVRAEAKAAYRECDVVSVAVDESVVLRAAGATGFTVAAVTPANQNGANGAPPFGLAAVGAATTEARFGRSGPYDLSARPRRFRLRSQVTVTTTLAADDPSIANVNRVFGDEVAAVVNRELVEARVPVRVLAASYPGNRNDAVRIDANGAVQYTVGGTAAATLGVTKPAADAASIFTPLASHGPWNLGAAPQTLIVTVTTEVEVRLGAGVPEIPNPAAATGADVRAAINRQLAQSGLQSVVAEPIRRSLAVRRSATEATDGRHTLGGLALADLVATPAPVAGDVAQRALFDVVGTHAADTIAGGVENRLYLRSTNTGNVDEPAVRHRLLLVDATAQPLTAAPLGAPIDRSIVAGASAVVEFAVPVPAAAAGERRFVVAIADIDAADLRLDLAGADLASLEAVHAFCVAHAGAALREFVVR